VIREPDVWWLTLFYIVTFGGFVGLTSFLAIFFHDQYGVNIVAAGNLAAVSVLAGSLLRPVGGVLADRFGGFQFLRTIYAAVAGLMILAAQIPSVSWIVPMLFLLIGALGLGSGAVFQLVPQRFPRQIGAATGMIGAGGGLGGSCITLLLGISVEITGSYATGFRIFGVLAFVCFGVVAYLQRGWRRQGVRSGLETMD
jgi:NNP family nitrate/nitrite transporter-like MFS transporter